MAYLPDRRSPLPPQRGRVEDRYGRPAHIDPPAWRAVPRRKSSGMGALALAALVVAAGFGIGYLMRGGYGPAPDPAQRDARTSPERGRPARTPTQSASVRCSADGTIHGWQGNGSTGITPHDWLHFLPPCEGRR